MDCFQFEWDHCGTIWCVLAEWLRVLDWCVWSAECGFQSRQAPRWHIMNMSFFLTHCLHWYTHCKFMGSLSWRAAKSTGLVCLISRVWVRLPVVALVSLSKIVCSNCVVLRMGHWAVGPVYLNWRVMAWAVKSTGFKLWCLISRVWVRIPVVTLAT